MIASHFLHAYIVVQPFTEDGKNKYKVIVLFFDWIAIILLNCYRNYWFYVHGNIWH